MKQWRIVSLVWFAGAAFSAWRGDMTSAAWAAGYAVVALIVSLAWFQHQILNRTVDGAFMFAQRHHHNCMKAHPDMTHQAYLAWLPDFEAGLAETRRQRIKP